MKKTYSLALSAVLIWATMAAVVKSILSAIPNMEALTLSSLIASLFLFFVNLFRGKGRLHVKASARDLLVMAGLGLLGMFGYSALYYQGLSYLSSQEACILNYLWPMMLVLFSALILKEKLTVVKIASLLISFSGVVTLSLGGVDGGAKRVIGIVCCIGAAALYGLFSVLNKKQNYDQFFAMMVIWFVSALLSFVLGLLTETWIMPTPAEWAGLAWIGVGTHAAAYLLWALALQGTKSSASVANLAYLVPLLSLIVSAIFLKESLQPIVAVSFVLILGGILLQAFVKPHRKGNQSL